MAELKTKILLRNDTAEHWADSSLVLQPGEAAVEFGDKTKIKIGDGSKIFSELPYVGGDEAQVFQATSLRDLQTKTANPGDMGIVIAAIGETDKKTYTAYVYNGSDWEAMDGNYDATNVYFDDDLTYTVAIGTLAKPSGSAKLDAKGKSVKQVLSSILAKEANPNTSQPSATLNSSNIGSKEVGTNVAVAFNFTTNAGSYTYGPATGVTFNSYSATFNGETIEAASGTFASMQVTDATNLTITGSCKSTAGATPVTNLGNAYPAGKINEKSYNLSKGTLSGYRGWFQGYYNGTGAIADPTTITSAQLRAFGTKTGFTTTLTTDQVKQVFWAAPAGEVKGITIANSVGGAPMTVKKITDVMVEGANGYTAIAYDVYYVNEASAHGGSETWNITITK